MGCVLTACELFPVGWPILDVSGTLGLSFVGGRDVFLAGFPVV